MLFGVEMDNRHGFDLFREIQECQTAAWWIGIRIAYSMADARGGQSPVARSRDFRPSVQSEVVGPNAQNAAWANDFESLSAHADLLTGWRHLSLPSLKSKLNYSFVHGNDQHGL
jgi:hypothetical protein